MKAFVVYVVIVIMTVCCFETNAQRVALRAGYSLSSATHLSLRYEHWTNGSIHLSLGGFLEQSRARLLDYSCYGADLLAEYTRDRDAGLPLFGFRFGLGVTWQVVNEPWLYKEISFSHRMNYGLLAEANIDCHLSDAFRLNLFCQHKYLFRSSPGDSRFCIGIGLAYRLSSY